MSGWPTIELGQIADFRNGLNYTAADGGTGLAVVGVSDFQDKSFVDFSGLAELNPSALSTPDALVQKNDILFVRSNGNRELIGRSLLILNDPPKPTSHSGFTIRLRFTDGRANPRFFAYLLRAGVVRRHLSNQGGGTNINNLNQGILSRLTVPLPSLSTQHRIASILGAYDDLIEVNRRRIAVLEQMARGLFEEWFVRFRFPGHESVPILDTPNGPLPEGWTWGTLADIAQACGKSLNPTTFPDETFAHYSLPAFDGGRIPVADQGATIKSNKLYFDEPVALVSKLNPRIPRVWFVSKTSKMRQVASTEFVPIRPSEGLPLAYIFAIVSGEQFRDRLVGMAGGTSTSHQRVKPKDIFSTPVALAPRQLVIKAGERLAPFHELIDQLEAANQLLAVSRDLLLPRLISDQLSVTDAERQLEEVA